jgi:hypothetical protein
VSPAPTKGPVSQRELLPRLVKLIDDARAPNSTAHRDIARSKLRALLETTNWNTAWLAHNLGATRCRYLGSIGYWVPTKFLSSTGWSPKLSDAEPDE